jgi:hypothetical protein
VTDETPSIACRLDLLSTTERRREQELLGLARQRLGAARETAAGYRFAVPPDWLGEAGELLGLERRCCPFLAFTLEIAADQGEVTLHIHGGAGVKTFVAQTFGPPAS